MVLDPTIITFVMKVLMTRQVPTWLLRWSVKQKCHTHIPAKNIFELVMRTGIESGRSTNPKVMWPAYLVQVENI